MTGHLNETFLRWLNRRTRLKIRGGHPASQRASAPNLERRCNRENLIGKTKRLGERGRRRDLDNRKWIFWSNRGAALYGKKQIGQQFKQHGVNQAIQNLGSLRGGESALGQDGSPYTARAIEDIPTEFIRNGLHKRGVWHIQALGQMIQINMPSSTRSQVTTCGRFTRGDIANNKNGIGHSGTSR